MGAAIALSGARLVAQKRGAADGAVRARVRFREAALAWPARAPASARGGDCRCVDPAPRGHRRELVGARRAVRARRLSAPAGLAPRGGAVEGEARGARTAVARRTRSRRGARRARSYRACSRSPPPAPGSGRAIASGSGSGTRPCGGVFLRRSTGRARAAYDLVVELAATPACRQPRGPFSPAGGLQKIRRSASEPCNEAERAGGPEPLAT